MKVWEIYQEKKTGQFIVRNTLEQRKVPKPEEYLFIDSSINKRDIKQALIKCLRLGADGYFKDKLNNLSESTDDKRLKIICKNLK